MANTYKGILTNNGKALIANATVNNKINYSHIAVGDGNGSVPTPSETRPTLINEKARIALNVVEINPNNTNQIVCEAIIPTNTGGFYIRELGLYAGNTMVVNASYPPTYKPLADEGGAREIAIKIVINIQNAEVIALYLDDSLIYATREWVNNNYIRRNEIVDNLTTDDSKKPLSAKQGKVLNEKKVEVGKSFSDSFAKDVDYYQDKQTEQYFKTFDDFPLGSRILVAKELNLINTPDLQDQYFYVETKTTYMKINPGRVQIAYGYANGSIAVRSASTNAPYGEWKYIANTTSNVASATKLQTARKIFGQNFDGTADVTGNVTASTGILLADPNHYIDMGRNDVNRMNFATYLGIFNFIDTQTGNIVARLNSGGIDCNAATATKLSNARKINTIDFDGTKDISVPTIDAVDNLNSSDTKKPLSANQGRILNEQKLNKATEQNSFSTDKEFLDKYATRITPSFFFDGGFGKFFNQYTVGIASSLDGGAYFVIGASPVNNQVKVMTGVRRENGNYDLQKNLTLLDSESNNVVNGDFIWDNHKNGGWARGLAFKAKADSNVYSGFGAFGNTDTVEKVYFGFGGDNLWSTGNGKGIWIDQYKAFTNCNWEFSGAVSGSFFGTFDGSIQAKDIRNVSPNQIQGGKMGYFFAEYTGIRYGTVSGGIYGDFIALNGYKDASGGKVNGLFFDKTNHQIYHFQNGFGTNNWGTPRQIAYTDNQTFTGSNKFTGEIQVDGPVYAQKFRGESDFWFTSADEQRAKRLLSGGLLTSDNYLDASKIPNFGLYAKGHIYTSSDVCSDTFRGYASIAKFTGNLDGKLLNARMINGVAFDASYDINIPPVSFYIPAGANLNNYQSTGFFFQDADAAAQQIANVPVQNAFALRVERSAGCSQWFTPYNGGGLTYYRHFYNGFWSNWVVLKPNNVTLSGQLSGSASFDNYGNVNISASVVQGLGINQTWRNVTSQRAANTTYTNNRAVPIKVAIYLEAGGNNAYANISVGGEFLFAFSNTTAWGTSRGGEITVPPNTTYRVDGTFSKWSELT
ncbi:phage tail protein [Acinetobacter bereziniae]|uniref:phage tail-collar fiber domain-containing protein n=1 Tax=Acinetobacter bereziniae TaxID=106648 RepID=UPI003AF77898